MANFPQFLQIKTETLCLSEKPLPNTGRFLDAITNCVKR